MATPLDLPRRVAASIGSSIDAAGELPQFQRELLEHLRSMDAGIQDPDAPGPLEKAKEAISGAGS